MDFLTSFLEKIQDRFTQLRELVRSSLFGQNNEKLDLMIDSFYRLSPSQRSGAMVGCVVGGVILVAGVIGFYFVQSRALEKELNNAFNAMYALNKLESEFRREESRFDQVVQLVNRRTAGMQVKPFFEDKAQSIGLDIADLRDQKTPLPSENPLSKRLQYVKVDMKSVKPVSIPRLLKFVTEIEKSNKLMSIEELKIRGRFQEKLYFDTQMKFRTYASAG